MSFTSIFFRFPLLGFAVLCSTIAVQAQLETKVFFGKDIEKHIDFIAQSRIDYYKSYPYFYRGDEGLKEELDYVNILAKTKNTALVLLYKNKNVVGFCCATPLVNFTQQVEGAIEKFEDNNLDSKKFYYISDVIITKADASEQAYKMLVSEIVICAQKFKCTALCLAEKPETNDSLKPVDYKSMSDVLIKNDFKESDVQSTFSWKTLQADGSIKDQTHQLVYWIKDLKNE